MSNGQIKLLADENFRFPIVEGSRRLQPAIDIQTAGEANLIGVPDPVVLGAAVQLGRIFMTHDERTMPQHFAAFLSQNQHSPGVFLSHKRWQLASLSKSFI